MFETKYKNLNKIKIFKNDEEFASLVLDDTKTKYLINFLKPLDEQDFNEVQKIHKHFTQNLNFRNLKIVLANKEEFNKTLSQIVVDKDFSDISIETLDKSQYKSFMLDYAKEVKASSILITEFHIPDKLVTRVSTLSKGLLKLISFSDYDNIANQNDNFVTKSFLIDLIERIIPVQETFLLRFHSLRNINNLNSYKIIYPKNQVLYHFFHGRYNPEISAERISNKRQIKDIDDFTFVDRDLANKFIKENKTRDILDLFINHKDQIINMSRLTASDLLPKELLNDNAYTFRSVYDLSGVVVFKTGFPYYIIVNKEKAYVSEIENRQPTYSYSGKAFTINKDKKVIMKIIDIFDVEGIWELRNRKGFLAPKKYGFEIDNYTNFLDGLMSYVELHKVKEPIKVTGSKFQPLVYIKYKDNTIRSVSPLDIARSFEDI